MILFKYMIRSKGSYYCNVAIRFIYTCSQAYYFLLFIDQCCSYTFIYTYTLHLNFVYTNNVILFVIVVTAAAICCTKDRNKMKWKIISLTFRSSHFLLLVLLCVYFFSHTLSNVHKWIEWHHLHGFCCAYNKRQRHWNII